MDSITSREAEIAKIAKSADRMAALQRHLKEITQGKAFKGSLRSAQFLTYIVEQAIAGNFESLKERVIGAELFQRSPSYDTGEDAIVRVTASDVRKRLLQHYDRYGATSGIRISLPLGSYAPEIRWDHAIELDPLDFAVRHKDSPALPPISASDQDPALVPKTVKAAAVDAPATADLETSRFALRSRRRWLSVTVSLALLNLVLLGALWNQFLRAKVSSVSVLPWSVFFRSPHPIRLITSDPTIAPLERMTGSRIPLIDYENHNYPAERYPMTPESRQFLVWGDWTGPGDLQTAVNIAELAQSHSRQIIVQPASKTRLQDLKTDDNFIFLGSPRSDPWVSLFNDWLDFQFVPVDTPQKEVIRNVRPRPNEQSIYAQDWKAGPPGETFAIVAFVQNPDQDGQVLILAGESGLATDVAGRLVTDLPRLSLALQKCGTPPSGPLKHFELLLRVSAMAGSSRGFEVMACHILPDTSAH
jgi:hypothetical protein